MIKELDLQFRLGSESARAKEKMIEEIETYNTIEHLVRDAKTRGKDSIELETQEGVESVSLPDAEKALEAHKSARKAHEERMGTAMSLGNSMGEDARARRKRLMAIARQWMKQIK